MLSNKKEKLFKFLRTRHLFDVGGNGVSRDDLVLSEKEAGEFLRGKEVWIEEKVDGANIGISMNKDYSFNVQNRSHFVFDSTHKQFQGLSRWIEEHASCLCKILEANRHILFGEWLLAKHSIRYDRLNDFFLAFDIFDERDGVFYSPDKRNELLKGTTIQHVPKIAQETDTSVEQVIRLLDSQSQFYGGPVEGVVLRALADEPPGNNYFKSRTKIVRPDFIQSIEKPWTQQTFTKNLITYE